MSIFHLDFDDIQSDDPCDFAFMDFPTDTQPEWTTPPVKTTRTQLPALPKQAKREMNKWLCQHQGYPYMPVVVKDAFATQFGISVAQVTRYLVNARKRLLGRTKQSRENDQKRRSRMIDMACPISTVYKARHGFQLDPVMMMQWIAAVDNMLQQKTLFAQ